MKLFDFGGTAVGARADLPARPPGRHEYDEYGEYLGYHEYGTSDAFEGRARSRGNNETGPLAGLGAWPYDEPGELTTPLSVPPPPGQPPPSETRPQRRRQRRLGELMAVAVVVVTFVGVVLLNGGLSPPAGRSSGAQGAETGPRNPSAAATPQAPSTPPAASAIPRARRTQRSAAATPRASRTPATPRASQTATTGSGAAVADRVTVANPGTHTGTVGFASSLQIHATDSATGQTLSYSAVGLPAGLSINPFTGLISGAPTAPGDHTVTVIVKDATGASGTTSFAWDSRFRGGGTCRVTYTRDTQWPGGWRAQVVIGNTGPITINRWSLTFTFPGDQRVTQNYNGGFFQNGESVTLTNAPYNGTIGPGGSVTDGFQGTWIRNDSSPTRFAVNGTPCT